MDACVGETAGAIFSIPPTVLTLCKGVVWGMTDLTDLY